MTTTRRSPSAAVSIGAAAVVVFGLVSCDSSTAKDSAAQPDESSEERDAARVVESPDTADVVVDSTLLPEQPELASPTSQAETVEASQSPYEGGHWEWYGGLVEAAIESEPTSSLADLADVSDVVIVGRLKGVEAANMVELAPGAPSSRVQFVTYTVAPRDDPLDEASFQLAVPIRTEALEDAVQATINPEDLNGDGELDDNELAVAIDQEAIQAVYDIHWDAAVDETLSQIRQDLPAVETLFFLRRDDQNGEYRPVNGDSIVVNDAGTARIPWREGQARPGMSAVQDEINGRAFEEIISEVVAVRDGDVAGVER